MNTADTIAGEIADLKDEFEMLSDWTERYQYIMEMGRKLPPFPPEKQDEAHLFHGCQSQVWFDYHWDGDKLVLDGTSDALIVKGLIALLFRIYSNRRAVDIIESSDAFIEELGLNAHLSANRATGLVNMIEKIKQLAQEKQTS